MRSLWVRVGWDGCELGCWLLWRAAKYGFSHSLSLYWEFGLILFTQAKSLLRSMRAFSWARSAGSQHMLTRQCALLLIRIEDTQLDTLEPLAATDWFHWEQQGDHPSIIINGSCPGIKARKMESRGDKISYSSVLEELRRLPFSPWLGESSSPSHWLMQRELSSLFHSTLCWVHSLRNFSNSDWGSNVCFSATKYLLYIL